MGQIGQFAFICYDDPNNQNKEYGPECAQKAIDAMNDKEIATGVKLCVKHALKKAEREIEKVSASSTSSRCSSVPRKPQRSPVCSSSCQSSRSRPTWAHSRHFR